MPKIFPVRPAHPERICWGCDRYCAADQMLCGNGSVATPHPSELFGEDWQDWGLAATPAPASATAASGTSPLAPEPEPGAGRP